MKKIFFVLSMLVMGLAVFSIGARAISTYDVVVVREDVPTDYIIASIYTSTKNIPLVLIDPDNIADPISDELIGYRSRGYQMLLIIGGESAISENVENELKSIGFIVSRLWDWNRYGTAARVSIDLWGDAEKVIITNGEDFSGFLIAQRIALDDASPILFIKNSSVPVETVDALKKLGTKSVVLISSDEVVSSRLREMGLSVETIETTLQNKQLKKENDSNFFLYLIVSVMLIAIIFISLVFRKKIKHPVFILTEDEEKIIEILKTKGRTGQNELAKLVDFSKPRISRMIRSLEERKIIEREKYKKTFKIKLKRNFS